MQVMFRNAAGELIVVGEARGNRPPKKKHERDNKDKVYLEFRTCKVKCFNCKQCDWFWGQDKEKLAGQRAVFGIYPS
jgi:hypothetical protein